MRWLKVVILVVVVLIAVAWIVGRLNPCNPLRHLDRCHCRSEGRGVGKDH